MPTKKKTEELSPTRPIHSFTDEELSQIKISDVSFFIDHTWYFPNPTPGAKISASAVRWNMRLLDGTHLTDHVNSGYLRWCRRLILSVVFSPMDGPAPAPASMPNYNSGIKFLISWMSRNCYRLPHELTAEVISDYIDDLPGLIVEEQEDEEISPSKVRLALNLLLLLWRQRNVMSKMGIRPIPHDPFYVDNIVDISNRIATRSTGWIHPLPDEVAIPIFNRSEWFLGVPANDLLRLLGHVQGNRGKKHSRTLRTRTFLDQFRFTIPPEMYEPWHPTLDANYETRTGISRHHKVRQLFEAVRDACIFVIQGTTGMRISEVLGIKSGIDPGTGLPSCVRVEVSITGQYEWFLIKTNLYKTEPTHMEVDWILGMRPLGSDYLPPPVCALIILNMIYEPWRPMAETDLLILGLGIGPTLPLGTTKLGALQSDKLRDSLKRYISRWIDLSGLPDESMHKLRDNDLVPWRESRGEIFTSHMLRKSWANFVLAVDSRLLPAIQMQFHHISQAMTELGYIGSNPLLVKTLNSVIEQKTNLMLYECATGRSSLAGRMGEQIEESIHSLANELQGLSDKEKWKRTISLSEDLGLRIFFSSHGNCCPTRISEMRCHNEAGTPTWVRSGPNYTTRDPTLCAGCACYILDGSHQPFWAERYIQYMTSYRQSKQPEINRSFSIGKERADQAAKILSKLGVDINQLDAMVALALEQLNAKT